MAMIKSASIMAYFRRSDQPNEKKRPSPDSASEESRKKARKSSPVKSVSIAQSNGFREPEELPLQQAHSVVSSCIPDGTSPPDPRRISPILYPPTQLTPNESASFDSCPTNSQPFLTSSRRIVKNGEAMVRNSDDESDTSLEDLDDLLGEGRPSGRSSPKTSRELSSPDDEMIHEKKHTTRGATRAKKKSLQSPYVHPVLPKKYKFSLETLLKHKDQDEASKNEFARAKSMLHTYEQDRASANQKNGVFDTGLIDSVMREHGDADDVSKLKSAIQRTEALEYGKSWSFFDDKITPPSTQGPDDFPVMQDVRLHQLFGEELPRQQAFLSGFAGEYAMKKGLPEEFLLWLMDTICVESRDDLRHSYTSTLTRATEYIAPLLTIEYIDVLFQKLGATTAAIDSNAPIIPHAAFPQSHETATRPGLLSVLSIIGSIADYLIAESRAKLLNTLCRLALDHSVIKNFRAITAIEEAFASLIHSIPEPDFEFEIQTLMKTTYQTITDPSLRLQLLKAIPAHSPRLTLLRRRLATSFFFQDPHHITSPKSDLKHITHHLHQTPQYNITHTTDFTSLAALIDILSIAVDSGDPPPHSSHDTKKEAEAEISLFNKDVDALTTKINSMFSDIVDTGASHMKRTEAKEVLEGFQRRLEYVVRTKPKPKRMIFGDAEVVPLQERMRAFLDGGES